MIHEGFAELWGGHAGSPDPMAQRMNEIPKPVASNTLDTARWQNCSLNAPHGDHAPAP